MRGEIDGILGVEVHDRLGVTIDLQRQVASLKLAPSDSRGMFANPEAAMHHCDLPFNEARASAGEDCFDPEIVLSTPAGEYRGRKQVMPSLNEAYFKGALGVHFEMTPHDFCSFGEAFCYSYDYRIDKASPHRAGHGWPCVIGLTPSGGYGTSTTRCWSQPGGRSRRPAGGRHIDS